MVRKIDFGLRCRGASRLADTYEVVDDPSTDSIISWSENGKSFIVWKPEEFAREFLATHGHCFKLFTKTLDLSGFKKVKSSESERWEFADENFVRGKPELLKDIYNRKDSKLRIIREISFKKKLLAKDRKKMITKATKEATALLQNLQL